MIEIQARAGEEDRLYGSVTNLDIAQHLSERGVKVDRRRIDLEIRSSVSGRTASWSGSRTT